MQNYGAGNALRNYLIFITVRICFHLKRNLLVLEFNPVDYSIIISHSLSNKSFITDLETHLCSKNWRNKNHYLCHVSFLNPIIEFWSKAVY